MFKGTYPAVIAVALMAMTPMAKAADPDAESLLTQVKQIASQGQDSQTAAQVNQFVDEHHDIISAVLKMYLNYLKQIQTMTNQDDVAPAVQPQSSQADATELANTVNTVNTVNTINTGVESGFPAVHVKASGGLQTSSVQPSGGLTTGHLAGYPSLPDVDPTSSITRLTAAQAQYAAKVRRENLARKEYLMEHPEGYSY